LAKKQEQQREVIRGYCVIKRTQQTHRTQNKVMKSQFCVCWRFCVWIIYS